MNVGRGSEQMGDPENDYKRCTLSSGRSWHCQQQSKPTVNLLHCAAAAVETLGAAS